MTPEFKAQWIAALRSGKYKQHHGAFADDLENPTEFCCMSVGMIEDGTWIGWLQGDPPGAPLADEILGISRQTFMTLQTMNDCGRKTFSEIADWLEKQKEL